MMNADRRPLLRLLGALLLFAGAPGCITVDASFKTVTFAGTDRTQAFAACMEIVTNHYQGTTIRADEKAGRIETDPVEELVGGKTLRQQCYVQVQELPSAELEVAVMAILYRLEVDHGGDVPYKWRPIGSDVRVEGILLDEITGRILALVPDARVLATTLPKLPGR